MDGILLIDKPAGWTSFDVVNKVRRLIATEQGKKPKQVKVGHSGTLDPLATGLLVILVGSYCKRAQEFSKLDKIYEVTMRLGKTSTTGDDEGDKTSVSDRVPTPAEITAALHKFRGEIMQVPPIYSAIKVNGQRAYKLAREGKEVQLEPRSVTIYAIRLDDYKYPDIRFTASVSSGTYIRSLAEDVGDVLKTGAYMADLRRSQVGDWQIVDAAQMEGLTASVIVEKLQEIR